MIIVTKLGKLLHFRREVSNHTPKADVRLKSIPSKVIYTYVQVKYFLKKANLREKVRGVINSSLQLNNSHVVSVVLFTVTVLTYFGSL